MSFFKDFKEDLSTAVNELMPGEGENNEYLENSVMGNSDADMSVLEGLNNSLFNTAEEASIEPGLVDPAPDMDEAPVVRPTIEPARVEIPIPQMKNLKTAATDENAVITEGMTIHGNLESTGSVEVRGVVVGDVVCGGKLVVSGVITGNTKSSEFYADNAKVQGEIVAEGTVKIGAGSVIIGNISATSSVVAGAVKGDIDVHGPVVVDTSAVVMGNIKSRSVQINNGAVIEGFCSQCYSEIDVNGIFG